MAFNRLVEIVIQQAGTQITFKDLKITFNVVKTNKESVNRATVQIYNVSAVSAVSIGKEKSKILIRAGYEDEGIKTVFFGDVTRSTIRSIGSDSILDIEGSDGGIAISEKNVSISFSPGSAVSAVIDEIVSKLGLTVSGVSVPIAKQYVNGYQYIGKAVGALSQVTAFAGKKWTIQNNQILIYTEGEALTKSVAVINQNTGLLDSPEPIFDKQDSQKKVPKRWKVKSLLLPQIAVGSEVRVESTAIKGSFVVEAVEHNGDNIDGDFMSEMEVRA